MWLQRTREFLAIRKLHVEAFEGGHMFIVQDPWAFPGIIAFLSMD